ncbi:MAG: hypothetical protein HY928_06810 [Elusimicrobia bacterium]|nr:hypothetical protein [Elusimicrobiota bacterium]
MISVMLSAKGGVGKTTLALVAALETGAGIFTNDLFSPIDKALPPGRCVKLKPGQMPKTLDRKRKIIFDFGGYADRRMIGLMKVADVVVIPTVNAFADLQVTIRTIRQVAQHTSKILVVVNRAKPGDLDKVRAIIHEMAGKYPVLELKTSKALARLYKHPKPVSALVAESPLNAYVYGDLHRQVTAIITAMSAIATS